eukprot:c12913_g1_i1.p1 GENE.c12913_g1_i1~~c12913_g1_i1.p1  ORF type:complete len:233 (-),score=110.09 c12913_g1_i1:119-817(-)
MAHNIRKAVHPLSNTSLITLEPKAVQTSTVFLIHGLGDSASGWLEPAKFFARTMPSCKFILPTAPSQPVTWNGGMVMPSWYDIVGLNSREKESAEGIQQSKKLIEHLIQAEIQNGIPANKIVVGGFSQGGALSIFTGLQQELTFAGVLVMSGYLTGKSQFQITEQAKLSPVLHCHGKDDPLVRIDWARDTAKALKEGGVKSLELKEYDGMAHELGQTEMNDIQEWLLKVLPQ